MFTALPSSTHSSQITQFKKKCTFWSLTFASKTFWASAIILFSIPSSYIQFPDYTVTPTTCNRYQWKWENEDWSDWPGWILHKLWLCATFALVWANSFPNLHEESDKVSQHSCTLDPPYIMGSTDGLWSQIY